MADINFGYVFSSAYVDNCFLVISEYVTKNFAVGYGLRNGPNTVNCGTADLVLGYEIWSATWRQASGVTGKWTS